MQCFTNLLKYQYVNIMPLSNLTTDYTVQFSETDAAGLVHFSNYFRYMERAEWELFQKAGLLLIEEMGGVLSGWPRVQVECSYSAPLRFGDAVRIHLKIEAVEACSIRYAFRFYKVDAAQKLTLVANGCMTTVYAEMDRVSGVLRSKPLAEKIQSAFEPSTPFTQAAAD